MCTEDLRSVIRYPSPAASSVEFLTQNSQHDADVAGSSMVHHCRCRTFSDPEHILPLPTECGVLARSLLSFQPEIVAVAPSLEPEPSSPADGEQCSTSSSSAPRQSSSHPASRRTLHLRSAQPHASHASFWISSPGGSPIGALVGDSGSYRCPTLSDESIGDRSWSRENRLGPSRALKYRRRTFDEHSNLLWIDMYPHLLDRSRHDFSAFKAVQTQSLRRRTTFSLRAGCPVVRG